jgi:hypothetical protein
MRAVIRSSVAAGAALAILAAGQAQALQRADVHALDALLQRALDLSQSLTEAAGAQLKTGGESADLACLETLRDAAGQVSDQLKDVRDVTDLATRLRGPVDRWRGIASVRRAAAGALAVLPIEARQTDQTAKLCGPDAGARAKLLDALIGDATTELTQLRGPAKS